MIPTATLAYHTGFLIAGPTDVQLVGLDITTVINGATAVVSGSAGCAFPTGAVGSGSSVEASCNLAGQAVVNAGGVLSEGNIAQAFPQTVQPIIGVQVPDSGPGAVPSASATAAPSQNTGGAAPSATGGAASSQNGSAVGAPASATGGASPTQSSGGSAAPSSSGSESGSASSPSATHNGAMRSGGRLSTAGWGVVIAAGFVLANL